MKVVYKYGTGQAIPDGGTYLCTLKGEKLADGQGGLVDAVWHYFIFPAPGTANEDEE